MLSRRTYIRVLEAVAVSLLIGGINLLFPAHPGFMDYFFLPYVAVALVVASAYGSLYGILSLLVSAACVAGGLPLLLQLIYAEWDYEGYWKTVLRAALVLHLSIASALRDQASSI